MKSLSVPKAWEQITYVNHSFFFVNVMASAASYYHEASLHFEAKCK